MKRIKFTAKRKVLRDSFEGQASEGDAVETDYFLASDGGLQEVETDQRIALHCGHFAEAIAVCSHCSRIQCSACGVSCHGCARPLGKCHATQVANDLWLCSQCLGSQKRASLFRFLLSPLIRFKDSGDAT